MDRLSLVCGTASTVIFVIGTLPMLIKAAKTRDLSSYSLSNMAMANLGNAFNTVYVLSLPPGPVWGLHGFNTLATALMLFWYLRYRPRRVKQLADPAPALVHGSPEAIDLSTYISSPSTTSDDRQLVTIGG